MKEPHRLEPLLRSALAAWGDPVWLQRPDAISVTTLAVGTYHTNFLVLSGEAAFVARYNRSSQWNLSAREQLEREFATLCDLAPSGVTPLPLGLLDGNHPFLLESFLPGRAFDYSTDSGACGLAIAQAHACPPLSTVELLPNASPYGFLLADGKAWLDRVAPGDAAENMMILRRVHEVLSASSPVGFDEPDVILHTDLIQSNILRTESGCVLVDWEGARLGPRAWDLAYFLSPVTERWARSGRRPTALHREEFLRGYAVGAGVDVARLDVQIGHLMPYVMFRALSWCLARLHSGEERSRGALRTLRELVTPRFLNERFQGVLA